MREPEGIFGRRGRTRTLVAIVLAGALVGMGTAANAGWHAWRDPHVFRTNDFGQAGMWGKISADKPMNVGMSYARGKPVTITVDSAYPRVLVNSAEASITVSVCTIDRSWDVGLIGSVYGDPSKWCSKVVDPDGARLRIRKEGFNDQLVVTIRPTRPGIVMVWGVDVTYGYGHRHGTQHVGENVRFVVRAPSG